MTTNSVKLILAAALLLAVTASGQTISATNRLAFNLIGYYQSGTTTTQNGTTIARVAPMLLNNKFIAENLGGAANSSIVEVTTWGTTSTSLYATNLQYSVSNVTYAYVTTGTNTNAALNTNVTIFTVGTNSFTTNLALDTSNFTFAITFTNLAITNPALSNIATTNIAITWIDSTAGDITTNAAGSPEIISNFDAVTNGIAVFTNPVPGFPGYSNVTTLALVTNLLTVGVTTSNFNGSSSAFYLSTPAPPGPPTLVPLTTFQLISSNTFTTNATNGIHVTTVTNTTNNVPIFTLNTETNAGDEFRGDEAIRDIPDYDSGAVYSAVRLAVNAPGGAFQMRLHGFDLGAVVPHNTGTAAAPAFYNSTNSTITVTGWGYMNGSIATTTTTNATSTNVVEMITGGTPLVIRGTVTSVLYGRIR